MSINKQQLTQLIYKSIIEGIRRNGDRILSTANNTEACFVPVDTGMLRKSSYVKQLPNGVEVGFIASYAADIEFGKPTRPIVGTQEVFVRRFRRKDGTIVNAHTKRYVNKRLIAFRPKLSKFERGEKIFRVINEEKEQSGQFFLTRAFQKELPSLPQDIEFFLREIERK